MTLAEYLRTTGQTHNALADKLNVSQVTVYRWATGRRFPDRDMILRIEAATARKVKPADWFKREASA
jgi:transcriptional regulator with XRE-family HTH domain